LAQDLSYADDYTSTGIANGAIPLPLYANSAVSQFQTYQPHWCAAKQHLWKALAPAKVNADSV